MGEQLGWKKIVLIALTILILGPLVFIGTCFPIAVGAGSITNDDKFLIASIVLGSIISILVMIWVIRIIIKRK